MSSAGDLSPFFRPGADVQVRFGTITAWNAGTGVGSVAFGDGGTIDRPAWIVPPVAYAVNAVVAVAKVNGTWLILGRVTVP